MPKYFFLIHKLTNINIKDYTFTDNGKTFMINNIWKLYINHKLSQLFLQAVEQRAPAG